MKTFLLKQILLLTYLVVFFGLLYGVYKTSGTTYFGKLFLYFFALLIFYVGFNVIINRNNRLEKIRSGQSGKPNLSIYLLLIPTLIVVIGHLIYLQGFPAFQALNLKYIEDVAMFRNSLTADIPAWIGYPVSIVLTSALPFLLLYFLIEKKTVLYWVILVIGSLYAFSLMQKSYIVGFVLPALIFAFATKRYIYTVKYIGLIVTGVLGLSYIANPPAGSDPELTTITQEQVLPENTVMTEPGVEYSKFEHIVYGIADRLFVVPGRVVSGWFKAIPDEKPFLHGDGYRIFALVGGKVYHNYSIELYPIIQPEYAAMGLTGSVNAASFMYEYSNFGNAGLIISGFVLALILVWLEFFFRNDQKIKISLCLFPVLLLSSGAITTLLFSGGFGFTILFYYIYLRNKTNS